MSKNADLDAFETPTGSFLAGSKDAEVIKRG
jgi:hypothetical protein